MKKTLILMLALASGVACAEYKDGNGGKQVVTSGNSVTIENPTISEYHVSGKGGAFYVENGATLNLTGSVDFSENYQDEEIAEGAFDGHGIYNDVYLENGATLNISAEIAGVDANMHIDTESGAYWEIVGGVLDSVSMTGNTFSGSVADSIVSIEILDGSATPALTLTNVSLINSTMTFDPAVSVSASGLALDASSYFGGDVLLSGSNTMTLAGLKSDQLEGVTLGEGAALALTLTQEQLEELTGSTVTIELVGLSLEGDAAFTAISEEADSLQILGYTTTDGGVSVTVSTVVPEPTTATLSLLALAALAARRRRR
ncbi:MAG: PEP-CTERM sorting domain-containing protein [Akkermansia sp.]|nr:PEP-CTERM sorting domain-containing protein [Akkermansia sp.]